MEVAAQIYIDKIDAMGGSVTAIENGYIQQEIANASYKYQKEIEAGERVIVGVNKFTEDKGVITDILNIDESIRKIQIDKINQLKSERNNEVVTLALANLTQAAKSNQNLMPFIVTAVENYATLGEISDSLREIFGEY
jgi:methylmalonyl-CoA mutase N-terminal domain/subunit